MTDCLFCKIAAKEIPAKMAHEDDLVVAFHDIRPQAPVHVLIIPREHIATINDLDESHALLVGRLTLVAKKIARELQIDESGYRLVFNCNRAAGQEVFHIHLHLLGGRSFQWPPG